MPAASFLEKCLSFSNILNASITASWVILAVLVLRLLLKKAPKWTHVALWGLVALRLLLPFPIESVFSLIPSTETLPHEILAYEPVRHSEPARLDIVTNPVFSQPVSVELPQTVNRVQRFELNMTFLWWAGIALMLAYTLISYWRLRHRVREAVRLRENIYRSERISTPFVLGIFRPRIYLPFGMSEQDAGHVIAHERAHIHRRDHWWKPMGFLLLTFHWFNPLMWLAYILLCRDIELACDEKVVKTLSREGRADYSQALLKCSVSHRAIAACPLAFGEVGVKERVSNVLNYKKPAFWIILAAVIACILVAVCFLTDPVNSSVVNPWVQEYVPGTGNILGNVDRDFYETASPDFAIGADQYGRAVFKDPHQAFQTFQSLYAEGIRHVQESEDLPPLTQATAGLYKKFGWQVTGGTEEQQEQARFVTKFLDIYENSFSEEIPVSDEGMEPTKQALSLEKVVELSEKGEHLGWEDFENYASKDAGSGLYILHYEIDDVFSLKIGGPSPEEAPWYIRLYETATEEYIDLRTDDPIPFIDHVQEEDTIEATLPDSIKIDAFLEEAISAAILEHSILDRNGLIYVESHIVLDNEQKMTFPFLFWQEQRVIEETVYLVMMESTFRTDTGVLDDYFGSSVCPVAITFSVDADGKYTLKEYWEPRDGRYFNSDIRRKFPTDAANAYFENASVSVADASTYFGKLMTENQKKAEAYIAEHGTTYTTVEYLLKQILPYDATAKNPQLWLDESPEEYARLLDLGEGTLYYCFSQFLEGGQTDMRGHIMALLCQQIMQQWKESYEIKGGGQDWFDNFRNQAEALTAEYDLEVISKHHPGVFLLLEMTAKIIPAPAVYVFPDYGDLFSRTAITLQEDGTFWFSFSPLSSYIGHGDYSIENGRLILPTDDGRFTYYFDILDENTLSFDAEASSDMVWFSELQDGDILTRTIQSSTDVAMTPLEELPDSYSLEQAGIDGCLVMVDSDVREGQKVWERFLADTQQGKPAFIRIVTYYSERQFTERAMEIFDLYYNGFVYSVDFQESTQIPDQEFQYLRRFAGEVTDGSVDYDAIERYILTNDPDATPEALWKGAASSKYGDLIANFTVYSDVICYPDHPASPQLASAALEMDGQTLVSVTDPDALSRLEALLSGAEALGYEPKTYHLGVSLVLTTGSGEVQTLELNLLSDLIIIGQAFYDYGPGYTDVGAYDGQGDLFAIFGLTHWPDAVYEKYGDWLGPIPTGEPETDPVDQFPGGSILVWYPDLTCEELDYKHPVSTILEAFAAMELEPTNQPQPELEEAEYTLHIAYNNGEEFDLVYAGNGQFFYRIFKTQKTYTFTSHDLHSVIKNVLDSTS